MQNNNDFWLGGVCGAKNHGEDQLVILNSYDTSTKRFDSSPPLKTCHLHRWLIFICVYIFHILYTTKGHDFEP